MKKLVIPVFCLFHLIAISWWTLPHSFGNLVLAEGETTTLEYKLFNVFSKMGQSRLANLSEAYIDSTGSQQYWDFFAPHSTRFHQYISVCDDIESLIEQEIISCKDKPLFSNLTDDFAGFKLFGSNRSRYYRLTENLIALNDPALLKAFADYYRQSQQNQPKTSAEVYVIAHQFELHPGLKTLPKPGYRIDKLLISQP